MDAYSDDPKANKNQPNAVLCFTEISVAIKAARRAKSLPILKLANLSGCDPMVIDEIESGLYGSATISDVQDILKILNINLTIENVTREKSIHS